MEIKSTEKERLETICKPEMIPIIMTHVRNGGSLIDLARHYNVKYSNIVDFVRSNKDWSVQYNEALRDRSEFTREEILVNIKNIASADIRKLYDKDGKLLPVNMWPSEAVGSIIGLDTMELAGKKEGEIKKVKRESALKAWELLGKTEAMFVEKTKVEAGDSLAAVIAATFNREKPSE